MKRTSGYGDRRTLTWGLIAAGVLALVVFVVFWYWRRRKKWDKKWKYIERKKALADRGLSGGGGGGGDVGDDVGDEMGGLQLAGLSEEEGGCSYYSGDWRGGEGGGEGKSVRGGSARGRQCGCRLRSGRQAGAQCSGRQAGAQCSGLLTEAAQ